jgi:hypothetical protein
MEGQLGHKKFDFLTWNRHRDNVFDGPKYKCGYAGCAIGECPIVFPGSWVFSIAADPVLKENKDKMGAHPFDDAKEFFALDREETEHLFVPDHQDYSRFGGMPLGENATRQQVAMNIYAFIEVKKKEMADA